MDAALAALLITALLLVLLAGGVHIGVALGATGFLGRHLRSVLQARGWAVAFNSHAEVNLLSQEATISAIAQTAPDVVIHCAARCGGIGANRASPATFWRENLLMGLNVLEACSQAKVGKLVMLGTTCSYPKYAIAPFQEDRIFDGYPEDTNAPYGIAKRALMVGAESYRHEFGLRAITVIPTNLYGPGDNYHPDTSHVIPAMIRKFSASRTDPVKLWGTGSASRDFLYVEDAALAIALAAEKYNSEFPVNLGSGYEITIRDLALIVQRVCGHTGEIVWDDQMPDGQPRRVLDTERAETVLGWKATTALEDGIRKTAAAWVD